MTVKINCETEKGGAIELNKAHGVWASYAVATVGSAPPAEIFYAGIKLRDGSSLQFFANRETGLVVVDHVVKNEKSGSELIRQYISDGNVEAGRAWKSESLEAKR